MEPAGRKEKEIGESVPLGPFPRGPLLLSTLCVWDPLSSPSPCPFLPTPLKLIPFVNKLPWDYPNLNVPPVYSRDPN